MNEIRAYYKVSESIATSGQPTAAQFSVIAAAGYEMVINLALPSSSFALENEHGLVESLVLGLPDSIASYPMVEIWQPSGAWERLIEEARKAWNAANGCEIQDQPDQTQPARPERIST